MSSISRANREWLAEGRTDAFAPERTVGGEYASVSRDDAVCTAPTGIDHHARWIA